MGTFDALVGGLRAEGDAFLSTPPDDWRQGRTLFGGLTAALCLAACERIAPGLPPLRAGQVAFIGPAAGEVRIRPQLLRLGKSVSFMAADLVADGALAARCLFAFGGARASAFAASAPPAPDVPPPDACPSIWPEGAGPQFRVHLDQRTAGGLAPLSGADRGDLLTWVRHRTSVRPSAAALVALGDALPPASFTRFTGPAMISSVTWSFDLFAPHRDDDGCGWLLLRSTDDGLGEGYAGQQMAMWRADGTPVLLGRQSVAIFA